MSPDQHTSTRGAAVPKPSGDGAGATRFRVVVIGAGMSGVLMAHRLKSVGVEDLTVYEKGDGVGGTWRENSYPGLHCDVPSHHYCYSFRLNPDWSKAYASGAEIREYFERSAAELGVMSCIQFHTAVVEARWADGGWAIKLSNGHTDWANVLISAAGVLHVPVGPDIPGADSFAGAQFHTTRWDHNVALEDKRIGIIGTGSTACQIVAGLGGKVRHLTLFQRTAQWVARIPNSKFSALERARFRKFPFLMAWKYQAILAQLTAFTRDAVMGKNPVARKALEDNVKANLATVKDPELRRKLTPYYEAGCKRLVMSPNFYEAIQEPGSELVTERIERIEPSGVRTVDGKLHELDVLVYATGFDPHAYLRPVKLHGRNGRSLDEVWRERPISYRSIAVPDMPNFFMLEGPYSPIGNFSLVKISETQAEYVMKCIDLIRQTNVALSPEAGVTNALINHIREEGRTTIWSIGGCNSWMQDKEGVPIFYPFAPAQFLEEMAAPDFSDFIVEDLPGSGRPGNPEFHAAHHLSYAEQTEEIK